MTTAEIESAAQVYAKTISAFEHTIEVKRTAIIDEYVKNKRYEADFLANLRPQIQESFSFVHDYKQFIARVRQNINVVIEARNSGGDFNEKLMHALPSEVAIYWTKPEFHRRLILIACCALSAAAFGRFPSRILPPILFYSGVDLLILLGVTRDLIVSRSIHRIYRYALPAIVAGQVAVMYTVTHSPALWMKFAHAILS